eukprot:evm.model.scf_318.11 EVM.evm.TU.scf_318.11   scf_318:66152-73161(+)
MELPETIESSWSTAPRRASPSIDGARSWRVRRARRISAVSGAGAGRRSSDYSRHIIAQPACRASLCACCAYWHRLGSFLSSSPVGSHAVDCKSFECGSGLESVGKSESAGSEDGQLVIWDFETYSVAKVIKAHSKTVTGVCWSRDGRYIVTSSLDQTVTLWNVLSSEKEGSMTLESAVVSVAASRLEPGRCLVTMAVGPPLLLDLKHGTRQPLEPLLGESEVGRYPSSEGMTNIAIFDKSCTRIIVAHPKGYVYVLSTDTLKILDIVKVPATSRVLGLHLNRKGNLLLANCDRCIRMFDVLGRLEAWEPGFDGYEPQEAIIKASKEVCTLAEENCASMLFHWTFILMLLLVALFLGAGAAFDQ